MSFKAQPSSEQLATFQFLSTSSDTSLDNFVLSRYARDRQLKKDIFAKVEECIDNLGDLRLAERIREYRQFVRGGK